MKRKKPEMNNYLKKIMIIVPVLMIIACSSTGDQSQSVIDGFSENLVNEVANHYRVVYEGSQWINKSDAENLIKNGCFCIAEGANMPSNNDAVDVYLKNKILFGPGKAANAGGVAVSGLEMSQNSIFSSWSRDEVDLKLSKIMKNIHSQCIEFGSENNYINYVKGANIAGFIKVADSMLDQGVV